jgi:hypothetical protein
MSKAFDFDEQLSFGKEWEERFSRELEDLLLSVSVQNIDYDENPDLQRAGIDSILQQKSPTIQIKTQSHEYAHSSNLPFETMSVEEESVPGWIYTETADLIVWVFPNKPATNFYKQGYLMPFTDGLVEWFNERVDEFYRKRVPNTGRYGDYYTAVRLVPIADIPDEFLARFDPRLPTERDTPQTDLERWTGGTDD